MKMSRACLLLLVLPAPAFAGAWENGLEAIVQKDYVRAIACFTACIEQNPKDAKGYSSRGFAHRLKKEYDKAIADCSQAIVLDPKFALAYFNRGNVFFDKREYDKAIADYSDAIRLDPNSAVVHGCRADSYANTKEYAKAIADYTQVIQLDPSDAVACNDLAWILATCPDDALRDGSQAVEYATTACESSQWQDPQMLDTLAAANAEAGKFKAAVQWEQKAIDLGHDPEEKEKASQRLKLYEDGKPYRDQ